MVKRGTPVLLAVLGFGLTSCGVDAPGTSTTTTPVTRPLVSPDRYRAFADVIAAQLQASGVPGGALGIIEQGRLVFATGLGVKRAGGTDAVGVDTVFRVASTTKPMTAAMIMSLVQEGRVSLDAPVTRYLPGLRLLPPFDPAKLTLRRLLSHTAAVPDYTEIACAEGPAALGDWFDAHPNLVLWSPPGRLWSYSNLGFSLAALVAERAAGLPYRDLVERRVLGPLGMRTATFDVDEVVATGDHAVAHAAAPLDITLGRCALLEPPGYMYASVNDLARFSEALLRGGGPALRPWSLLQMALPQASTQAPPDAFYGLGLMTLPYKGRLLVGHPGDLPGMHSSWWLVPEARFGVIMLVNGDGYDPTAAAIQAVEAFVKLDRDIPPPDWSTSPADWVRYEGHYDGRVPEGAFPPFGLGLVTVALQGDQLILTTHDDGASYRLFQAARDTFVLLVGQTPVAVTFWRDGSGKAEYLATRAGHARRSAAPPVITPPPTIALRDPAFRAFRALPAESVFERIAREYPLDPTLTAWRALAASKP